MKASVFQYIENHDHARFICRFGMLTHDGGSPRDELMYEGDRSKWEKVRPYLIGLLTAKGIPLIWQGQEFLENYYLPESGWGRVRIHRAIRWEYFYDEPGKQTVSLVRKLTKLRRSNKCLTYGDHDFWTGKEYLDNGVLVFTRTLLDQSCLIVLNFTDSSKEIPLFFKSDAVYNEIISGKQTQFKQGLPYLQKIEANSGMVWIN